MTGSFSPALHSYFPADIIGHLAVLIDDTARIGELPYVMQNTTHPWIVIFKASSTSPHHGGRPYLPVHLQKDTNIPIHQTCPTPPILASIISLVDENPTDP